jgi:hypothetical protein
VRSPRVSERWNRNWLEFEGLGDTVQKHTAPPARGAPLIRSSSGMP